MKKLAKKMILVLCLPVLILILSVVSVTLLNKPICKGKLLKPLRLCVQIFCPPQNLYELILEEKIDIANTGTEHTFNCEIEYIGPYSIGVLLDELNEDLQRKKYPLKLKLLVQFYLDGKLVLSKETTDEYRPFLGKDNSGLILADILVPDDLPIDKKIDCKVKIVNTDEYLSQECEQIFFYMKKKSEL